MNKEELKKKFDKIIKDAKMNNKILPASEAEKFFPTKEEKYYEEEHKECIAK